MKRWMQLLIGVVVIAAGLALYSLGRSMSSWIALSTNRLPC